jgi:D-alanyl-D-alanine carboxypeptidase (penicillin-binding protein 5/6)
MFDYGFEHFTYKTIIEDMEAIQEVPVELSKLDHVTVYPAQSIEMLIPKGLEPEHLERTIVLQSPVEAPVEKGQKLGSMTLSYDGTTYGSVDLLAGFDVEASKMMTFWRNLQVFFSRTVVRVICIVLVALILLLIGYKLLFSRKRYRYGRSAVHQGSNYRGRRRR